jgi:hypothetical protein
MEILRGPTGKPLAFWIPGKGWRAYDNATDQANGKAYSTNLTEMANADYERLRDSQIANTGMYIGGSAQPFYSPTELAPGDLTPAELASVRETYGGADLGALQGWGDPNNPNVGRPVPVGREIIQDDGWGLGGLAELIKPLAGVYGAGLGISSLMNGGFGNLFSNLGGAGDIGASNVFPGLEGMSGFDAAGNLAGTVTGGGSSVGYGGDGMDWWDDFLSSVGDNYGTGFDGSMTGYQPPFSLDEFLGVPGDAYMPGGLFSGGAANPVAGDAFLPGGLAGQGGFGTAAGVPVSGLTWLDTLRAGYNPVTGSAINAPSGMLKSLFGDGVGGLGLNGLKGLIPGGNLGGSLLSSLPILSAIDYAKSQGPFDTSRLESLYGQYNPQAAAFSYDQNSQAGRRGLESSLQSRGVMGSSFGNADMYNFDTTRELGRNALVNQGVGQMSGIASSILDAQMKSRAMKNDLYGRSLLALGNVFGGRNQPGYA